MIFVAEFKFLTFKNEENALIYAKSFYFANFQPPTNPPPPPRLETDLKIRTARFKY